MTEIAKRHLSRLWVDKIGSSAVNLSLPSELMITKEERTPVTGDVVVVQALTNNANYNKLELTSGRLARINPHDIIVGVLGRRRALRGIVGDVPEHLKAGDKLSILNLGGVIGCSSGHFHEIGRPIQAEYLGTVFRAGKILNIADNVPTPVEKLEKSAPLVLISGTSMNCGKTLACTELIKQFTRNGYRVAGAKLSGVACLRDTLDMVDHGAIQALSFLDCGHPSTVGIEDISPVARTLISQLNEQNPDLIVIELGDGIIGGYNVDTVFTQKDILEHIAALIFCAPDFVGAWGGIEIMRKKGVEIDVICGASTDSQMGVDFIQERFGLKAANALSDGETLFELIQEKVNAWKKEKA